MTNKLLEDLNKIFDLNANGICNCCEYGLENCLKDGKAFCIKENEDEKRTV